MKQSYILIPVLTAFFALQTQAAIIFSHDFSGGTTADLDGATTTTGGATWVATNIFDRNGNVNQTNLLSTADDNSGRGSATLAFTPINGNIYTAESSLTLTSGGSTSDWISFGFANGQSNLQDTNNRFGNDLAEGRAWLLTRLGPSANRAWLKRTNDGLDWSGLTTNPSNLDLRIVLDTTGGTGAWTATWFAKESTSSSFTEVRGSTIVAEDITSIGFSVSGDPAGGSINSFSLTAVPEPSVFALIAGCFGLGWVMFRRRRS